MERMAILCEERVAAGDLAMLHGEERRPLLWRDIERQAIEEALRINRATGPWLPNNWESACALCSTV